MFFDPRTHLIICARQFYQQGWMVGTSGNLSAKMPDESFWITASGKSKGQLQETDFVRVTHSGDVIDTCTPNNRPSAETSIHQAIYSLFPDAKACFHVHSVEANLVSSEVRRDNLPLPPLEMVKGLGVWEENPQVAMPVFENYLEVPRIAQAIRDRFSTSFPPIPALLIRYHGVTVWANSIETAQNYVEVAEYIFRYLVAAKKER
jgi:methylthioribulose-1-phosphate dehydratase